MNIIELANELQGLGKGVYDNPLLVDAANMLRQQADRIAELEKDLEGCEYFLKAQTKRLSEWERDNFTARIYNCRTGAEAHEIVLAIEAKLKGQ
jgi:hypothetical protein